MQAQTIQEVLDQLQAIISQEQRQGSPLGYFAALYRQVTDRVKAGIEDHFFDDGPRMARLDVVFANRYLAAFQAWSTGGAVTKSWRRAFQQEDNDDLMILQHLLLGINAHINLDLGIAAATVAPGDQLIALKDDFDRINQILGDLLDPVEAVVGRFSPLIHILDHIGGRTDERLAGFSIELARRSAWEHASLLANAAPEQQAALIQLFDQKTAFLGKTIAQPGRLLEMGFHLIRELESRDHAAVIEALAGVEATTSD